MSSKKKKKKKQYCIISSTNKGDYAHFLVGYLSEQRMIGRVRVDNFKIKIRYLNIKILIYKSRQDGGYMMRP